VTSGDDEDGCGNVVPVESQKRFPQGLGNLAQNARFPHSHKPIIIVIVEEEEEEERCDPFVTSTGRW
jgi:hypothetical protein